MGVCTGFEDDLDGAVKKPLRASREGDPILAADIQPEAPPSPSVANIEQVRNPASKLESISRQPRAIAAIIPVLNDRIAPATEGSRRPASIDRLMRDGKEAGCNGLAQLSHWVCQNWWAFYEPSSILYGDIKA